MAEQALADARAKTEQVMASDPADLPPLFGVSVSVKDLNSVEGVACAYGIKAACDRIASQDDYIVSKLRQAGLVILGKTATSQMGSLPYTEPPGFPPARNPWNLDYTPGAPAAAARRPWRRGCVPSARGQMGAVPCGGQPFAAGWWA
jgi:amidase